MLNYLVKGSIQSPEVLVASSVIDTNYDGESVYRSQTHSGRYQ